MNKLFTQNSKIVFVGAGNIANSLAPAISKAGYQIPVVFSKSVNSAQLLAEKLNITNFATINNLSTLPGTVVFLTVPDSQIKNLASQIVEKNIDVTNKLFVHLSGSKTVDEFKDLSNVGAAVASFHIMQTFSSRNETDIKGSYCSIETEDLPAKEFLNILANKIGLLPFDITSAQKAFYHMCGVFTSNFLTANFVNAQKCFEELNTDTLSLTDLVYPLGEKTLLNIKEKGITESLSGPVERADTEVVVNHVKAIKALYNSSKNKQHLYMLISYIGQSLSLLETANSRKNNVNYTANIEKFLLDELKNATTNLTL